MGKGTTWERSRELISNLASQLELRQASLGLNDFDLADKIGISRLVLARLKRGDTEWTAELMIRAADALDCDVVIHLNRRDGRRAAKPGK